MTTSGIVTAPQEAAPSDADDVERHPCLNGSSLARSIFAPPLRHGHAFPAADSIRACPYGRSGPQTTDPAKSQRKDVCGAACWGRVTDGWAPGRALRTHRLCECPGFVMGRHIFNDGLPHGCTVSASGGRPRISSYRLRPAGGGRPQEVVHVPFRPSRGRLCPSGQRPRRRVEGQRVLRIRDVARRA